MAERGAGCGRPGALGSLADTGASERAGPRGRGARPATPPNRRTAPPAPALHRRLLAAAPRHSSLLAPRSAPLLVAPPPFADARFLLQFTPTHGCVFWDDVRDKRMTYCKQMYVGINFCIGILLEEQVCFAWRACAVPAGVTTSFYVKTSKLLFSSTLWTSEETTQTINLP